MALIKMKLELELDTYESEDDYTSLYKEKGIRLMQELFEDSNLNYEGISAKVLSCEVV